MTTEDDTPPEPTSNEERLALNRDLFSERNRLIDRERDLVARHDKQPTLQLARELELTRSSLKRVTGKIVEANTGLVINRVSYFTKKASPEQRDEYMAAGMEGLIEAINNYDATTDNFAAYAYWSVKGAVLDAVHVNEHPTMSDRDFEKRPSVVATFTQLEQDSGGTAPSYEEVASLTGATVAQVRRILLATSVSGIHKTWGKPLSAKHRVSEFDDPPVDQVLSDNAWYEHLKNLLRDPEIDFEDLVIFIKHNMVPDQFGGPLSYEGVGGEHDVSRETARKADLRVRRSIESKGWKIPEGLEE